MRIHLYLRFSTSFGQTLWISDNGDLGTDQIKGAIPMTYLNDEFWVASLKVDKKKESAFNYKYILRNADGEIIPEGSNDRVINLAQHGIKEIHLIDTWNHAGEYENAFYTAPFTDILLKSSNAAAPVKTEKKPSHVFKVKAPLLGMNEFLCISGNAPTLGEWSTSNPILLKKEGNWWEGQIDLSDEIFPISYKYGIYNKKEKRFVGFENGDNRIVFDPSEKKRLTVLHDGFAHFPNNTWKGAGVAIPVFSLRSKKSFGTGEFNDLKLLADWGKKTGLKLIQVLPVNDTIANHDWADSYPYAAISAFALHPLYINLEITAGKKYTAVLKKYSAKQKELNMLDAVDYVEVTNTKLEALREIFTLAADECFDNKDYKDFFRLNKHWLIPYAAFCYLRDKYGTADWSQWQSNAFYNKKNIEKLSVKSSPAWKEISFHYFVQFHLHSQLKDAANHIHKKGLVLKGDLAIGVYRNGCDTWVAPELYHMDWQAGAPPDDFAVKGQNWAFPTYNWKRMQEDHFEWWRRRFEQMSNYFDAFRIDHILGFFRIWSIPVHAVEGIMGHFVPAIPVYLSEFGEKGIWFDYKRFCQPYITDSVLYEIFGNRADEVKKDFLTSNGSGEYGLKSDFDNQRKVVEYFDSLEASDQILQLQAGLFDLISNVILLEDPGSEGQQFHFRISADRTTSYQHLPPDQKQKIYDLYINYFYKRQDEFWIKEAMHKLPYLKRATNMLICGEDLGMVPHCVPEVMEQLGILSLEIQRMPKKLGSEFFHPDNAPYLSVITPSTHDMSTIRGWWEEDKNKIRSFYHHILKQWGEPPYFCEPWINRAIVLQHLYSPAMWSVFQLQDILGMSEKLRREDPHEERINVPADPVNKWKYRMHLSLEALLKESEFNNELKSYIENSGR